MYTMHHSGQLGKLASDNFLPDRACSKVASGVFGRNIIFVVIVPLPAPKPPRSGDVGWPIRSIGLPSRAKKRGKTSPNVIAGGVRRIPQKCQNQKNPRHQSAWAIPKHRPQKNLVAIGRGATSSLFPILGHRIKSTAALSVPGPCGAFWCARSAIATNSKQPGSSVLRPRLRALPTVSSSDRHSPGERLRVVW